MRRIGYDDRTKTQVSECNDFWLTSRRMAQPQYSTVARQVAARIKGIHRWDDLVLRKDQVY